MATTPGAGRRIVISVCPREPGRVHLPVERGQPPRWLDARAIVRALGAVVEARGLGDRVAIREACAGGCHGPGPNVSLTIHPLPRPGERPDHVAVGWRTYVSTLADLPCLAAVIDEHLPARRRGAARPTPPAR